MTKFDKSWNDFRSPSDYKDPPKFDAMILVDCVIVAIIGLTAIHFGVLP